jgi:hypothetical protein
MAKYRILQRKSEDGCEQYQAQVKILFWWQGIISTGYSSILYNLDAWYMFEESAHNAIKYHKNPKLRQKTCRVIHEE